jgi:hypothetical protein
MSVTRTIALATTIAALTATGVAGAAGAPVVGDQHFIAGAAPLTIPGTGIQKGEWMGSRARLLYRDVTLEGDRRARVTLRAPKGLRLRGLAVEEGAKLGFRVVGGPYAGRRSVTVRATLAPSASGEQAGRIYALAR